MLKPLALLAGASVLALAFPSAYERYRAQWQAEAPAEAAPAPPVLREAAVPARGAGRVARLPADAGGHFRAEASFNGRRAEVLVDTGATFVALGEREARRLGLAVARSDFRHEARTANGTARAAMVPVRRLALGPIELRDVEAMVIEGEGPGTVLLGMSFLKRLAAVELRDGALELRQ